jgi:hypothetical protein
MVFAKGRKPRARRREAVITAAKLRCLFSIRRSCHGLRTFLHTDGANGPVQESAALLPDNGERFMRRRARAACAARKWSTTNSKSLDQLLIARIIGAPEIIQNLASLRHKLQQPAPRVIVFDMCLEVLRQIVDPLRQEGNLHLWRTGISGFDGIRLDKIRLTRGCYRHRHQPLFLPARPAMPVKLNTRRGTISPCSTSAMAKSWPLQAT